MNTIILSYFQKNDAKDEVEEFSSLGGESGMALVQVDGEKKFFICWVWADGSYTRPSSIKDITVIAQDTDYLAQGALMYKTKMGAKNKIIRSLKEW